MREIKFRAWNKNTKRMLNGVSSLEWDYIGSIMIGVKESQVLRKKFNPIGAIELMQYTGLKDKNGKEIYEGDILRGLTVGNFWVQWKDKSACFGIGDLSENIPLKYYLEDILNEVEVIGNIYENPELLSLKSV